MQGPDIGKSLTLLECDSDLGSEVNIVKLDARIEAIRNWIAKQ